MEFSEVERRSLMGRSFTQSNISKLKTMHISFQKLQLVENIILLKKVEDVIRRNLEEHFQRIYIEVLFSYINQTRTGK